MPLLLWGMLGSLGSTQHGFPGKSGLPLDSLLAQRSAGRARAAGENDVVGGWKTLLAVSHPIWHSKDSRTRLNLIKGVQRAQG